ncbi:MAG: group II intron reverse transcriptase/maturase [Oscillospiraceae bacterium]|nr:group II intron reverse transcriptase/maturase [Oscillospiraceae bacterium]
MNNSKQYQIDKRTVFLAYKKVRSNKGSPGIDGKDFAEYEKNLKGNLYKLWNRMSSGSYFPNPVMAVEIPKKNGGVRVLGIPTIEDRVAQMTAKMYIEPKLNILFHEDSYGYRPNKSALDAVGKARERCWKYDYVIDLDIKGLFDNINHDLLMKAVRKHVKEPWILLYIERWLKAPFSQKGTLIERMAGTPQGGVISPVLANLFMHYAFDEWMRRTYAYCPFERYADDTVIHCKTEAQARFILDKVRKRMNECKLELHPLKTKIVYCKDKDRTREYDCTEFEFLGYTFRRTLIRDKLGRLQWNFLASVSKKACQSLKDKIKAMEIHKKSGSKIEMIAEDINPTVRGWMNYFGAYNKSAMKSTLDVIQRRLVKWAMCKYKRFRRHRKLAEKWLNGIKEREPGMFAHWALSR